MIHLVSFHKGKGAFAYHKGTVKAAFEIEISCIYDPEINGGIFFLSVLARPCNLIFREIKGGNVPVLLKKSKKAKGI